MCGCACWVCLLLFRTCDFYPMCMLGVYYCGEHATSILCADAHLGCVYYYVEMRLQSYVWMCMLGVFITM